MFNDILGNNTPKPTVASSSGNLWYLGKEEHPSGTKITFITNGKADISFDEITRQIRDLIDNWTII